MEKALGSPQAARRSVRDALTHIADQIDQLESETGDTVERLKNSSGGRPPSYGHGYINEWSWIKDDHKRAQWRKEDQERSRERHERDHCKGGCHPMCEHDPAMV